MFVYLYPNRQSIKNAIVFATAMLSLIVPLASAADSTPDLGLPLDSAEAKAAIERLKEIQSGIDTLVAYVRQKKVIPLLVQDINTEGKILLKKPNLLRWEIQRPEELLVVIDGKVLWQYRPQAEEATKLILSQNTAARYTMELFFSTMNLSLDGDGLSKRFSVAVYMVSDSTVISLKPKSIIAGKYLNHILIWINTREGTPEKFEVEGRKGSVTITEFSDVKVNKEVKDDAFKFLPPKGVRVIAMDDGEEFE